MLSSIGFDSLILHLLYLTNKSIELARDCAPAAQLAEELEFQVFYRLAAL